MAIIEQQFSAADRERIRVAVSCPDCDLLPRVPGAGAVAGTGADAIQLMHNGIKTYCGSHYGDYNVEVIRQLKGVHEPQEERVFFEVLKQIPRGGTIMELGSFWAYYSLWFLKDVADSQAILVEPVPSALEAGQRNFALNGRQGTFIHAAIDRECRPAEEIELWKGFSVTAETLTVDSLMARQKLNHLDVLHADIQGTEGRMLVGAANALQKKRIGWIFISTHSEYIHQVCRHTLCKQGYSIAAEHTPAESYSVDGLLVASAKKNSKIPISRRNYLSAFRKSFRPIVRVKILEPLGIRHRKL